MTSLRDLPAERLQPLRALVMDVDGVLTDGRITYSDDGAEIKRFHVRDGSGLKYWHRAGHISALLSGRSSPLIERRAEELSIHIVEMGAKDKLPVFESILGQLGVTAAEAIYIGDDLPDIPAMRAAGLALTVADAAAEVRDFADGVTDSNGGDGAVREVIEYLLKAQGRWSGIIERYFPEQG